MTPVLFLYCRNIQAKTRPAEYGHDAEVSPTREIVPSKLGPSRPFFEWHGRICRFKGGRRGPKKDGHSRGQGKTPGYRPQPSPRLAVDLLL